VSLGTWLKGWWGEDMVPAISREEAVERVRQFAELHGLRFDRPGNVHLIRQPTDTSNPEAGLRLVWTMALGTRRPMPFVEVDATDGTVVAWRQGLR
jgi:hypothetical protein